MTDVLNLQAAATQAPKEEKASNTSTMTCEQISTYSWFLCR